MPGAAGAQLTAPRGLSKLTGKPAHFQVRMPPLARLKPFTPYAILLLLTVGLSIITRPGSMVNVAPLLVSWL